MSPWRHGQYISGGDQSRRPYWRRPEPVKEWPAPKLGPRLCSLRAADFAASATEHADSAAIRGCKPVSSYSWMDSAKPTIMIPGKPPKWTPPTGAQPLPTDSGTYYRDPNAARHPSHPLEPAVLSVLETAPDAAEDVDVVACSSTLGNLFRFVRGGDDIKKFRILVQAVGGAVFFIRRENDPREEIPNVVGWGHTFPEAYTTWENDVRGSVNNQRIIQYSFAGLNCLVRSKCDGYLPQNASPDTAKDGKKQSIPSGGGLEKAKNMTLSPTSLLQTDDKIESLLADFSSTKVSTFIPGSTASGSTTTNTNTITTKHGGSLVPQSQVFDLKTRSIRRRDQDILSQELQRLWVAQIPNFVLAFHESGVFREQNISVRDVTSEIREWERANKALLSTLAAVVHKLVDLAKAREDGKIEVCHVVSGRGESVLEIREQLDDAGTVLSAETRDKFLTVRKDGNEGAESWRDESDDDDDDDDDDDRISDDYRWAGSDGEDFEPDYTACDKECGYCGRCDYNDPDDY